jgi:hypothetical protein
MIIKAKPLPFFLVRFGASILVWMVRQRFNKMVINGIEIRPGHSYILMCNHFGFLDGFFAYYLCLRFVDRKQMEKKWWLRYTGSFSVDPRSWTVDESINYAAELLSKPGNILLYYPQAELESINIRHIDFKDGINEIVNRIKGNCQLIWSSNLVEYFESMKPSAYMDLLDCGTNHEFNFEELKQKVNQHHLRSMRNKVRFTKEPGNLTY